MDKTTPTYYAIGGNLYRKGAARGAGALSYKAVLRLGGRFEGGK